MICIRPSTNGVSGTITKVPRSLPKWKQSPRETQRMEVKEVVEYLLYTYHVTDRNFYYVLCSEYN